MSMSLPKSLVAPSLLCSALLACLPRGASATDAGAGPAAQSAPDTLEAITVIAKHLDDARDTIQTQTGASTYVIDSAAIAATAGRRQHAAEPGILQAPDVAQDSFGQFHVRGEHNGLQYRLNGIILPEGISVFSQSLEPASDRLDELITGALPAEYGLRTAGIIDITTKSGVQERAAAGALRRQPRRLAAEHQLRRRRRLLQLLRVRRASANDLGIESPDGTLMC